MNQISCPSPCRENFFYCCHHHPCAPLLLSPMYPGCAKCFAVAHSGRVHTRVAHLVNPKWIFISEFEPKVMLKKGGKTRQRPPPLPHPDMREDGERGKIYSFAPPPSLHVGTPPTYLLWFPELPFLMSCFPLLFNFTLWIIEFSFFISRLYLVLVFIYNFAKPTVSRLFSTLPA